MIPECGFFGVFHCHLLLTGAFGRSLAQRAANNVYQGTGPPSGHQDRVYSSVTEP